MRWLRAYGLRALAFIACVVVGVGAFLLARPEPAPGRWRWPSPVEVRERLPPVDLAAAESLGRFRLTYYWIHEVAEAGGRPIFDRSCKVLARVSARSRNRMRMQGTGRLPDGSLLNIVGDCSCSSFPCFQRLPPSFPYGLGASGKHLWPYRSIAVDPRRIPLGTPIYLAELDGLRVPGEPPLGGYLHDGCVRAADRGGGIRGRKIDLFIAHRDDFDALHGERPTRVHAYRDVPRCTERAPQWSPEAVEALIALASRAADLLR